MAQKSEDLRVRKTRKLLQKALLELASEKGFANVTVRDLTERAMVNRSTFYRHYLDKYDLLSQYLEELYGLLDSQEGDGPPEGSQEELPGKPPAGLVSLLRHIQANADFYRVMLGEKGDPAFCARNFRRFLEEGLRNRLSEELAQPDANRPPIGLNVSYLMHAGVGAILWWLENDQPFTPEQMAIWLDQLSMANLGISLETGEKGEENRRKL